MENQKPIKWYKYNQGLIIPDRTSVYTTFVVKVEFESTGKTTFIKCSEKEQHKADHERKQEHIDQCQHNK